MTREQSIRIREIIIDSPGRGRFHPVDWAPSDASDIGRARAAGWKVLPVPRFHAAGELQAQSPTRITWHHVDTWVVVPPDRNPTPARRFARCRLAARWALDQIALERGEASHKGVSPGAPGGTQQADDEGRVPDRNRRGPDGINGPDVIPGSPAPARP